MAAEKIDNADRFAPLLRFVIRRRFFPGRILPVMVRYCVPVMLTGKNTEKAHVSKQRFDVVIAAGERCQFGHVRIENAAVLFRPRRSTKAAESCGAGFSYSCETPP
jgi:hypothetical protein